MRLAAALLLLTATGCASLRGAYDLPPLPDHLRMCAAQLPVDIPEGPKTRAQVAELLAQLRISELVGHRCAKDLVAWYESLLED